MVESEHLFHRNLNGLIDNSMVCEVQLRRLFPDKNCNFLKKKVTEKYHYLPEFDIFRIAYKNRQMQPEATNCRELYLQIT